MSILEVEQQLTTSSLLLLLSLLILIVMLSSIIPISSIATSTSSSSSNASQLPDIYIQNQSSSNTTSTNATTIDTIPPETQITSAIDSSTGANVQNDITMPTSSISFTFTGTDDDDTTPIAQFECSIDGLAAALCKSPVNLLNNNLTPGNHTFQVRAVDTSGNVDPSPASFSWTIVAAGTLPPLPDLPQQPPIPPLQQPPIPPLQQPPIPPLPTLSPL